MTLFFDRVTAGKTRRTADGYLVADAKVARVGIQEYLGSEVGRPDMPIVRVYRPESEVFGRDALGTYAHRPMTNNHPKEAVTADNWKTYSVGQTGGDVVRDGEYVRVPLVLMDSAAIADYEAGKRELSMGYEAEIVFQDGETADGQKYDAIQKNLRMNHLALVDKARGGDQLRIGDKRAPDAPDHAQTVINEEGRQMADNLRKVIIDGLTIETTEQGEQAINRLQAQLSDSAKTMAAADAKHAQAIADKDAEIAKRDASIDDLKGKVLTDADLDKRVAERADLITKAKAIADADYTGKSDAEIRAAVVLAKFGDAAVKDKPQAYIDARFDILVEQGAPDLVRQALVTRDNKTVVADADKAYNDNLTHLQNAWKGAEAK